MAWHGPRGSCGCCDSNNGDSDCPCSCYDPNDPDCNQRNKIEVNPHAITISSVTDTYRVIHTFEQDYSGQITSGGSVCNCYRGIRRNNYDFNVSGLSGLNGTYPSTTHSSTFPSPIGPCTTPTTPSGISSSGCGDCEEECVHVVWLASTAVTATLRNWSDDFKYEDGTGSTFGCNYPLFDGSSDITTNYTGYAFVVPRGAYAVGDIDRTGEVLQPRIRVYLWKTGDVNPTIEMVFDTDCPVVPDPGCFCYPGEPGTTWKGFSPCSEQHYLGVGRKLSGTDANIICDPKFYSFLQAPEFSCYTGSGSPTIASISCGSKSFSGNCVIDNRGLCDAYISDSDSYIEYSYESTGFTADFSLLL